MNDFFTFRKEGLSREDLIEADNAVDLSHLPDKFVIKSVASLEKAKSGDLSFFVVSLVSGDKYKNDLKNTKASYVLLKKQYLDSVNSGCKAIISAEPYITFTRLCKKLFVEKTSFEENIIDSTSKISQYASIGAKGVKIGKNVCIDNFAVIGDGVEIGDNTIIRSGVKIGKNCKIGNNCVLMENCVIQYTKIGDNCCIHPNSSIGQDGFGYSFDARSGKNEKINHFGCVSIGNNVEIGSSTCIDRSVFEETVIEDNVKIDNLVQIAHNVKVGCGTMMAGQSGIAGGAVIGKYCVFGGKSGAIGHINIGDRCVVYGDAKVTKSFPAKSKIIGTPGEFYHIWARNYAVLQAMISKKKAFTAKVQNSKISILDAVLKFTNFFKKK